MNETNDLFVDVDVYWVAEAPGRVLDVRWHNVEGGGRLFIDDASLVPEFLNRIEARAVRRLTDPVKQGSPESLVPGTGEIAQAVLKMLKEPTLEQPEMRVVVALRDPADLHSRLCGWRDEHPVAFTAGMPPWDGEEIGG